MATLNDILGYAESLANQGVGADADGAYGTQCVDLPNSISINFFGKALWGNAIDLLNSARDLGYEVEYNQEGNLDSKPRAGAVFVMDTTYIYGHSYGHTGLVIEDSDGYTMRTIEQNIDGNADSLYVGGPARYNTRDFNGRQSLLQSILAHLMRKLVHLQLKYLRLMYGLLQASLVRL